MNIQTLLPNLASMQEIKPCLFNFVVYCEQQERFEYCLELARSLAKYFPFRLFFVHHLKEKSSNHYRETQEGLNGWGASFYDARLVESSSEELYRVPFSLFPFLAPQLPIMLFWDCDPTEEKSLLPSIRPYAHRLIFDSETLTDLAAFAERMLSHDLGYLAREQIDLNWARLAGWVDLLAKVFDTEERIRHLRASSEIYIVYNARENRFFHHSQTEALYLQAHLAAQMGWQYETQEPCDKRSLRVIYRYEDQPVRVLIEPREIEQRAPGSLLYIGVRSRLGTEVTMDSRELATSVKVKSVCDASCTLPYVLPLRGSRFNSRFFQQLLYQDVSRHYQAMLKMLLQQKSST